MKVINISEKIVGIGDVILMPGDEKSFKNGQADVPGVRALAAQNVLRLEEEASDKKAVKKEAAEEPGDTPVEKKTESKPKRTKKAN